MDLEQYKVHLSNQVLKIESTLSGLRSLKVESKGLGVENYKRYHLTLAIDNLINAANKLRQLNRDLTDGNEGFF